MTVASLGKALDLFQLFTPSRPEWSVKELSEATGWPKGSISRMLATFAERGFLQQDPHTRRYRLGPAFLVATRLVHGHLDYGSLAGPVLQELADRTKETAIWMVRVGWRSLCQATVESPFPVRMAAEVGRYASLHSGASKASNGPSWTLRPSGSTWRRSGRRGMPKAIRKWNPTSKPLERPSLMRGYR